MFSRRVFRTLVLLSPFVVLPYQAAADGEACGRWYASVSTLSGGGTALNARTCSKAKRRKSVFEISCFIGKLNVRFIPKRPINFTPESKKSWIFMTRGARRRITMRYEAVDGAYAANIPFNHPLIKMMKRGYRLRVYDPKRKWPLYRASLKGSHKSIDEVEKFCRTSEYKILPVKMLTNTHQ